jgi:hypothetical protein
MTYTKPEVKTIGEAIVVIEFTHRKVAAHVSDNPPYPAITNPAYDLDE